MDPSFAMSECITTWGDTPPIYRSNLRKSGYLPTLPVFDEGIRRSGRGISQASLKRVPSISEQQEELMPYHIMNAPAPPPKTYSTETLAPMSTKRLSTETSMEPPEATLTIQDSEEKPPNPSSQNVGGPHSPLFSEDVSKDDITCKRESRESGSVTHRQRPKSNDEFDSSLVSIQKSTCSRCGCVKMHGRAVGAKRGQSRVVMKTREAMRRRRSVTPASDRRGGKAQRHHSSESTSLQTSMIRGDSKKPKSKRKHQGCKASDRSNPSCRHATKSSETFRRDQSKEPRKAKRKDAHRGQSKSLSNKAKDTDTADKKKPVKVTSKGSTAKRTVSSSTRSSSIPPPVQTQKGFSNSNSSSESGTATDLSSLNFNTKYLKAMRAGPLDCPDHILTKHSRFDPHEVKDNLISPFHLYYFDETAPNEVLLANDVKEAHPIVNAKKNLKAFLNCEGGKETRIEVEGDIYAEGVDGALDCSESDESTECGVRSFYTESAFTSVSANAIMRGRELQKTKSNGHRRFGKEGKNIPKLNCCGVRRKFSGPLTIDELSAVQNFSMRQTDGASQRGKSNNNPLTPQSKATRSQQTPRQSSTINQPLFVPHPPPHIHQPSYPQERFPQRTSSKADQIASPLYSFRGSAYSLNAKQMPYQTDCSKYSRIRRTNYVDYIPPATIAKRCAHPVYEAALAMETERQKENAHVPSVWPQPVSYDQPLLSTSLASTNKGSSAPSRRVVRVAGISSSSRASSCSTFSCHKRHKIGTSQSVTTTTTRAHKDRRTSSSISPKRNAPGSPQRGRRFHNQSKQQHSTNTICHRCHGTGHLPKTSSFFLCCDIGRSISATDCYAEPASSLNSRRRGLKRDAQRFSKDKIGETWHFQDMSEESEGSVHHYKPSTKNENDKDYGYHLRKHFFDATNLKVAEKGTAYKQLPQYSTSYQSYPRVCFDVIIPTSNKDFFRTRKAPGFF